jgi:Flp pilus assembly protein TadD
MHVRSIAASPDGKHLGVLAQAFYSEFADPLIIHVVEVSRFASQIFVATGDHHHRRGNFRRAAALFREARRLDPLNALATYNLALRSHA